MTLSFQLFDQVERMPDLQRLEYSFCKKLHQFQYAVAICLLLCLVAHGFVVTNFVVFAIAIVLCRLKVL